MTKQVKKPKIKQRFDIAMVLTTVIVLVVGFTAWQYYEKQNENINAIELLSPTSA